MAPTKQKLLTRQEKRLKKILQQISGDSSNIEGELIPEMVIRGTGPLYCYDPFAKEFIYITRGTGAYIIEELKDDKTLIYTVSGLVVEIESNELVFIGFD